MTISTTELTCVQIASTGATAAGAVDLPEPRHDQFTALTR
jgi:hypothetical protein